MVRYSEIMFRFSHLYNSGPNEKVPCQMFQQMDFSAWRENGPQFGPHPNTLPRGPPPTSPNSLTFLRNGVRLQVSSAGIPFRLAVRKNPRLRASSMHHRQSSIGRNRGTRGRQRKVNVRMNVGQAGQQRLNIMNLMKKLNYDEDYKDLMTEV